MIKHKEEEIERVHSDHECDNEHEPPAYYDPSDPHEAYVVGDDEGLLLVIHRVMSSPKAEEGSVWLRRSLFRT